MKKLLVLVAFVCLAALLRAEHRTWSPVTTERLWRQASNWSGGVAPGAADYAWIGVAAKPCIVDSNVQITTFGVASSATGQMTIVSGGTVTSTSWCGNGMGNGTSRGTVIVESGGTLNLGDHFWTGHGPGDIGTTIINGGTLNVSHQLGLGWDGGTGYMYVNSGVLNLSNWSDRTISGNSVMDVSAGRVIINGDQTGAIATLAAAGRITAYGGTGTVVYDYNVTNPGKTTITAINVIVNNPPVVSAGIIKNVIWQGSASVSIDGSVLDDNPYHRGTIGVDYGQVQWSCENHAGVVFTASHSADTGVQFSAPGAYLLRLQAVDDENNIASSSTLVSVIEPGQPNFEERAALLVEILTLQEKVNLMDEGSPAISRLGIPSYVWASEALHGVMGPGISTVFPQAIAMGSTWDPELIQQVASTISTEARIKNLTVGKGLNYWSPTINISRDPRWGRCEESYSEDPYLLSRFGVAFVKGMQGSDPLYFKTIATPKHYLANNIEETRHTGSSNVDMRNLRELYMPAFKATIQEAGAYSVMCAYNRVNGIPACASSWMLQEVLRDEWGFDGYVVSDCDAISDIHVTHLYAQSDQEASVMGVTAGCDLNCGEVYQATLVNAVQTGAIDEALIDQAAYRVLLARLRLGLFDPTSLVPYNSINTALLDSPQHKQMALQTAQKSIVLLKNNGVLPLDINAVDSIAVIGPNADQIVFGGYSGMASDPISPLRGIREKAAGRGISVDYAIGCEISQTPEIIGVPSNHLIPAGSPGLQGLKGEYFTNMTLSGTPVLTRIDANVNFNWEYASPDAQLLPVDGFSARWTGKLVPPVTQTYRLGLTSDDGSRLYLNGSLLVNNWGDHAEATVETDVLLQAGQQYDIRIEYYENGGASVAKFHWHYYQEQLDAAVALAASHDVAVVVVGTNLSVAREGHDAASLDLPGFQLQLIEQVCAVNPNTVVVLVNGNPLTIPWINDNCPAILETWYGGQAAGTAIADVLFGDVNPGGKLPVTFYQSIADLPDIEDYDIINGGRTYQYFAGSVLYPFGHGLSYTTFAYSNLKIVPDDCSEQGTFTVSFDVQNTGARTGDEVAQVYVRDVVSSIPRPIRSLKAFKRVTLTPGQTQTLTFQIPVSELAYFDVAADAFAIEPGLFEVQIGSSSQDIRLTQAFDVSADGVLNPDIVADGSIDLLDLQKLLDWWLHADCLLQQNCSGTDLDLSTKVDLDDLAILASHWSQI